MTPPPTPPPSPFDPGSTPPPSPFNSAPTAPSSPPNNPVPAPDLPWYARPWATIVALVVFPLQPVGIFLMWKYRDWERGPKVVATIVSLVFFSSLLPKSPDTAATRTASNSPSATASAKQVEPNEQPAAAPKVVAPDNSTAKSPKKPASKPAASAPKTRSKPILTDEDEQPRSDKAPVEAIPRNVKVMDIPNVGKRQVGIVNDVVYAVLEVEKTSSINTPIGTTQAGGAFFVLTVRAFNNDKKTHDVTTGFIKLLDDQDREFDPSSEGASALQMAGEERIERFSVQLQPGITKEFVLIYDAPDDASGLRLKIPAKSFSLDTDAIIKLPN